jgi:glycolate oxidase iron-sulfur subunit
MEYMLHQATIPSLSTKEYSDFLKQCVHCGLCLEACPTYALFRTEMDSPRGRITLMRAASSGLIDQEALKTTFKDHLSLCLGCLACESACPSGVHYGKLIEITTVALEEILDENPIKQFIYWLGLKQSLPHIKRLKFLAHVLWAYQSTGLQWFFRRLNVLPGWLRASESILPDISLRFMDYNNLPGPADRRGRVAFFHGCVQEAFLTGTNSATVRVLRRNGFEVQTPKDQTCCGAAQLHSGQVEFAKQLARQNIDTFLDLDVDGIISNAGGCGYALQEYPFLLRQDPVYRLKAIAFAERVKDFNAFIYENLYEKPTGEIKKRATFLDSCHLRHGQGVSFQPRRLLETIPGIDLVELRNPDQCCGSAGTYNLSQPEVADAILDKKISDIADTGASLLITSNTGCHLQILSGIRRAGLNIKVMHVAELLDLSYSRSDFEVSNQIETSKPLNRLKGSSRPWLAWQAKHRRLLDPTPKQQTLQARLEPGQVVYDPVDLLVYEQDASVEKGKPSAIVYPYTSDDVQAVMYWSNETRVPIVPRGAGTSLAGSAVAEKNDVILELSQMASILEFDPVGRSITVQPGAVIQKLGDVAESNGFYYPPDPASGRSATIGGTISTNAGGPHCF